LTINDLIIICISLDWDLFLVLIDLCSQCLSLAWIKVLSFLFSWKSWLIHFLRHGTKRKYCWYQYMFLTYPHLNGCWFEDCRHNDRCKQKNPKLSWTHRLFLFGKISGWALIWKRSSFLGVFNCMFRLVHEIFLWICLILTLDWGLCSDWLISSSCWGSLGKILAQRLTLEGFTSLLSLNSYFHWTPVGLRVLTLLSFETQWFLHELISHNHSILNDDMVIEKDCQTKGYAPKWCLTRI